MARYLKLMRELSHQMPLIPFTDIAVQTDPPPLVQAETLILTPKEMKDRLWP
jgi:hypothetical protein